MIVSKATMKRAVGGVVAAATGSAVVFGLMILMNGLHEPPEKPEFDEKANFQVSEEPDPPPKPESKPEPKPKSNSSPSPPAPPPDLASGVGTLNFDTPGFSSEGVEGATEELVGDVESSAMTSNAVDERPEPVRRVDPELPRRIVEKQIEGRVVVKALVDAEGDVRDVRIVSSKPEGVFDPHVRQAVEQWRFRPARYEGKAVKTWIELPFDFELG
jgi:protein TonB